MWAYVQVSAKDPITATISEITDIERTLSYSHVTWNLIRQVYNFYWEVNVLQLLGVQLVQPLGHGRLAQIITVNVQCYNLRMWYTIL